MHAFEQFDPGIFLGCSMASVSCCAVMFLIWLLHCFEPVTHPKTWHLIVEWPYDFVTDQLGECGEKYTPIMVSVFWFILLANLVGVVPGLFPLTSHFATTIVIAVLVWIAATLHGVLLNTRAFIRHFFIPGVPMVISPIIAAIELVTYCMRPFTLAIRLCLTIVVEHILLETVTDLVCQAGVLGIFGVPVLIGLNLLEIGVCILQAMIFTILGCTYIKENAETHHA